jgi:hypothetical protein
LSILRLKILLARTAHGTDPIIRKGLERSTGGNPAVRISFCWIVDIATDSTNIFLHLPALFLMNYRTGTMISYVCFFAKAPVLGKKGCSRKSSRNSLGIAVIYD